MGNVARAQNPIGKLALAVGLGVGLVFALPLPAQAATETIVTLNCDSAQQTWAVPANIASLEVTIAGGAGELSTAGSGLGEGGQGGQFTAELDAGALAGTTLNALVGCYAAGSAGAPASRVNNPGGQGSFLATDDAFLAVAGGGGGASHWLLVHTIPDTSLKDFALDGGRGGGPGSGEIGEYRVAAAAGGAGTVGGPGAAGETDVTGEFAAEAGHTASIVNGVITPGLGGYAGHTGGGGGSGYHGGGGGASAAEVDDSVSTIDFGTGGGGAGYVADPASVTASGLNGETDGFITFTFTQWVDVTLDFGAQLPAGQERILMGDPFAEPSAPTAAGWEFTGWFADEAATQPFDFSAPVMEPVTVYAGWVKEAAPVIPVGPTEPSEPTDPTDPQQPTNPVEPTERAQTTTPKATPGNIKTVVPMLAKTGGEPQWGLIALGGGVILLGGGMLAYGVARRRKSDAKPGAEPDAD